MGELERRAAEDRDQPRHTPERKRWRGRVLDRRQAASGHLKRRDLGIDSRAEA